MPLKPSAGHNALIQNANWAVDQALREMPDFVECWSGLLGLFYLGLEGEHDSPHRDGEAEHVAWHFRQALLAGALDTAKLGLDASMTGYYAQSMLLTRHLFESWLQLRYSHRRPDQTVRWFNTAEHGPACEPSYESIIKEVLKGAEDKQVAIWVNAAVAELRKAAHPSWWILEQVRGAGNERIILGGRYREAWAIHAFDRGTLAIFMLLDELKRLIPQREEWYAEHDRLRLLRNNLTRE